MNVSSVSGVFVSVWPREPLKGISDINATIIHAVGFEYGASPNATAAAPDAGFDEIAGHIVGYGLFETMPDIIKAGLAQHRMTV